MHQAIRVKVLLGGQQALRLHELQDRSDNLIHQTHLLQTPSSSSSSAAAMRHRTVLPAPSRTVEAILEARRHQQPHGSTAARFRSKIDEARGSICTERSERPEPLVPPLFARDPAHTDAAAGGALPPAAAATTTKRRIVAVRRQRPLQQHQMDERAAHELLRRDTGASRRLGKPELAWLEKQLQLTQRAAVLERECESWWRQFYGACGGGASGLAASAALAVHKSWDELPAARTQDARLLHQQLHALRDKQRGVAAKLARMRSGETFYAELQDLIEDLETAIAAFRSAQRERFDAHVADERVLEKELSAFAAKLDEWDAVGSTVGTDRTTGRVRAGSAGDTRRHTASAARSSSRRRVKDASGGGGGGSGAAHGDDKVGSGDDDGAGSDNNNSGDAASESELLARVRSVNERILQAGGVQGGWDDREHRVFLALLRKHALSDDVLLAHRTFQISSNQQQDEIDSDKGGDDYETRVARCLQQCIAAVVTRNANAVRGHLLWYIDHLALQQQKRAAIHAWRAAKDRARRELIRQGLAQVANTSEQRSATTAATAAIGAADALDGDEQQRQLKAARAQAKKRALLSQWRETKREREQAQRQREHELARDQEARDAKRKQELLDAKQQVQLYRLRKEQDAALSARSQPSSASPNSAASASPVSKSELLERSRQAIALAKAKRTKLQELEETQRKQRTLPARPSRSASTVTNTDASSSSASPLLLQPTKASRARERSKRELRREDAARQRQSAHDALIPGAAAIPDVRVKSFGHVPIQPRAVPAWRRTLGA